MRKVELVDPPALSTLPPPGLRRGRRSRRAVFLSWLRATHLYVGLWGATLGLLFGLTGILLNHRTILKIPVQQSVQRNVQLPLPAQPLETPEHLAAWLRSELKIAPERAATIKSQPPKSLVWADREVIQPERWTVGFYSPQHGIFAEYFVGNRSVRLDLLDATPIGTLTRLHMAVGVDALWVLLSDTIAGSLILLSLTGLLLWSQLRTLRTAAVLTSVAALAAALWCLWPA